MHYVYNFLVYLASLGLKLVAPFNKKIKLFVSGRKDSFLKLSDEISVDDKVIWMHCASLGEFEQGRPIIEKLKESEPSKKIVLTFFSPSGYEVRKDYNFADVICYLPLDTINNANLFLDIVHPEIAIFVKYEFWPNILNQLKKQQIKTILVSGIFRENQAFFKWYGSWLRKSLKAFSHFFVQDKLSKSLLNSINFNNITLAGDTRFDRVFEITKQNNTLNFIDEFKNGHFTIVAGSTWKDDENILVDYINNEASANDKFIIAPHNINPEDINELKKSIFKKVVLFSEKENVELKDYQVFIIDTIGILTKIYSYANVAYVGGGYTKSGVHNVLEPATFGIPIIIGPNYYKFLEAVELVEEGACFVVEESKKLSVLLNKLKLKNQFVETGKKAGNYVKNKTGATNIILKYIK
ncbi:glycosyltransferase N-terminal domain-containing protein [uncultured Lutibacter sp.]|uniref:3-deoxy-D-manno-octulosonic acid transferase n=1 Tax=uncultured Lutibacter sp. TaxID=437739 RepID=UPI00261739E0|nr:glycosyltransferase N-terminal domain-containing protein [uncultured Lutibacter sp.]